MKKTTHIIFAHTLIALFLMGCVRACWGVLGRVMQNTSTSNARLSGGSMNRLTSALPTR